MMWGMSPVNRFLVAVMLCVVDTGICSIQADPTTMPTTTPAMTSPEISLWPAREVPGAMGNDPDKDVPTLTVYAPGRAGGAAMIVCPGGGYRGLASHEGKDFAMWLSERGITAFVLKYRLGSNGYRHPAMLNDAQRAIRLVRTRAREWNIDPEKIGIMGSSAGGHLASTALTHFDNGNPDATDPIDRAGCRPNLGVLCYPVISMGPLAHAGSKANLLGESPSPEQIELLSNELQVTPQTPPCFIWHTRDDGAVKVENSLQFAASLLKNGVPYDLHIYQTGRHGLGLGIRGYDPATSDKSHLLPWTHDLDYWLKLHGFVLTPAKTQPGS